MAKNVSAKRVLVVDDEPTVTLVLAENLERLGDDYVVETAQSGREALARIGRSPFDLIITDLRMPGMDGLQLMEWVRDHHPHTRSILMTAYGGAEVEATAYRLGACRYLDKPFKARELMDAVRTALTEPEAPGRAILHLSDTQFDEIARSLADLRFEVAAQCILLADVNGQLVAYVGQTEGLELPALLSLIGGSFATTAAMARYLQEPEVLTLNYLEGKRYDIYSSNVNEELFVVLIFDKPPQRSRIGAVWLYTRRILRRLQELLSSTEPAGVGRMLDPDFAALLSDSLDQVLVTPVPGGTSGPANLPPPKEVAPADRPGRPREGQRQPPSPAPAVPPTAERTFSLQQAQEMGLLDASWLLDPDKDRREAE